MSSGHQIDMICLKSQYFKINKILLLAIGLWPYRQTKFAHLQVTIFSLILITAVIFQVKDLFERFQHICDKLTDENEIAIIEKYNSYGKYYTITFTVLSSLILFVFNINHLWTIILDVVISKNVSRPRHIQFVMEYFLDHEKYFYLNLIHESLAFSVGLITMLAIGTTLLAYKEYICGMFEIANYRIKHAAEVNIEVNELQNISFNGNGCNNNFIPKGIKCAVDMHRKAMESFKFAEHIFNSMFFWLLICGVATLSLNLLQISQIESINDGAETIILPAILIAACILYMFLANYSGQDIIDHNNKIFSTVYNVQWYTASIRTQKLIVLLLQRGNKEFTVGTGGLFVASLECFSSLLKASVSYFTVIYSTR